MITKIKNKAKAMTPFKKVTAIVLVLVLLSTITAYAADSAGYYVELDDGVNKTTVYTKAESADEIIKEAGIEVSALDVLDLSAFAPGEDSKITIKRSKFVGVNDGRGTVYFTFDGSVAGAIKAADVEVGENDLVNYDSATQVSDGMIISVARAFPVVVRYHGKHINLEMAVGTVADALKKAGVTLGKDDVLSHDLSEVVSTGMVIFVDEVIYKEKTETKNIPFDKTTKKSDKFTIGTTKVTTKGVDGEKEITYKQKYVNGELIDTVVLSEKVTKKPVTQVTSVGTKKIKPVRAKGEPISANASVKLDKNGVPVNYTRIVSGSSTAYYGGGTTASGRPAKVGNVAVDPRVIPYGTPLYIIATDGTVYGYAIAADTGGFVYNGTNTVVDVYLDTYNECVQWGRKTVNVYVLG
ncbi:MAG: G5 domain-containing protein [Clostridia bacterium]|nr:G5 domain-containing protein [Clostridia bacterium]